jgi:predicted anti-sigma-YlaC factor YlaD
MSEPFRGKLRDCFLDFFTSKCNDTSQLVSEAMDHRISIVKQCKIKFHLLFCEFCRHYKEQLETLRNVVTGLKKEEPDIDTDTQLESSAKERMKKLLDKDK